jgi:putative pyrroloquinoline-quinone binding quinoprotein
MSRVCPLLIAVLVSTGASAMAAGENWPQWRGPGGQGISTEADVPTDWQPDRNIAWKVVLPGSGHSSPVVWGDRIFLAAAIEGDVIRGAKAVDHVVDGKPWLHPDSVAADRQQTLKVLALDATKGTIVWEQSAYAGQVYDARHRRSSFAAPTAVTDGKRVFAYFGPEGLYAYDTAGKLLWKSIDKFRTLGLGTGTSPVLFERLVIVQRDENEGENSSLVAYEAESGKEAWRVKRPVQISWGTPVLVTADGRTELVATGSEFIIAYNPATVRSFGARRAWKATPSTPHSSGTAS